MNENLRLDEAEAWAESPIAQPVPEVPVTIRVGAEERPAFLDQARWLAKAWSSDNVIVPGKHHFDVIDALADPQDTLVTTLTTPT